MASLGHSSTQDSQPLHFSTSTIAAIYNIPFKKRHNLPAKDRILQNYSYITKSFEEISYGLAGKIVRSIYYVRFTWLVQQ
jgi:hypothetical protein